jgi:hypothetical protein
MNKNKKDWRSSALAFGRTNTAWFGELLLTYAPIAIIILMSLAAMSFVLGDGLAINPRFEIAWAWASALSVEGTTLALIVRASQPEETWKYAATIAVLIPMIAVGVALIALVTMQQTLRLDTEALAIHTLGIDPTALVIGRSVLMMFAALVGLVFTHLPAAQPQPQLQSQSQSQSVAAPASPASTTPVAQPHIVGLCYICGGPILSNQFTHVDHIWPRSKGGSDDSSNLAVVHAGCNLQKQNKLPCETRTALPWTAQTVDGTLHTSEECHHESKVEQAEGAMDSQSGQVGKEEVVVNEADELSTRLGRVAEHVDSELSSISSILNRVREHLNEYPGQSAREVARALNISPTTASKHMKALQPAGAAI